MHPVSRSAQWMFKLLSRIEAGEADSNDLDMLLELAAAWASCREPPFVDWPMDTLGGRTVVNNSVASLKHGFDPPRLPARVLSPLPPTQSEPSRTPIRLGW